MTGIHSWVTAKHEIESNPLTKNYTEAIDKAQNIFDNALAFQKESQKSTTVQLT